MIDSIRLAINGASGRMGRALMELARAQRRFALTRAVIDHGSALVGQPVQTPATAGSLRYSAGWEDTPDIDVVIDFSAPSGLAQVLDYCVEHAVPLVTGTTGLEPSLESRLDEASEQIAVLRSANFSLGVAVLTRLLGIAAAALPAWDLEILEMHHGRKQDTPSGTALALGEAAASARQVSLQDVQQRSRNGHTGPRDKGAIGFAVLRGGDVVGEHTAFLAGQGERIELTHRATDRGIFARGALEAAAWLSRQKPGHYDLDAMLDALA